MKHLDDRSETAIGMIGHNSEQAVVRFVVKGFNSVSPYVQKKGGPRTMALPVGATLRELVAKLEIPDHTIFLAWKNGRDVTRGLYASKDPVINLDIEIEEGDHISFSGPVPYSFGYGSAVV